MANLNELLQLEQDLMLTLATPDLLADPERFKTLVSSAMKLLDLADEDVAGRLPVSRSAVNHWRHGEAVPLPAMRKPVYKLLLRRVSSARGSLGGSRLFFQADPDTDPNVEIADDAISYTGGAVACQVPRPFDPSRFGSVSAADLAIVKHVCNIKLASAPLESLLAGDPAQGEQIEAVWREICQPQVLLCLVQALERAWDTSKRRLDESATQRLAQSVADLLGEVPSEPFDRMRPLRHVILNIAECIAAYGSAAGSATTVRYAAQDLAKAP